MRNTFGRRILIILGIIIATSIFTNPTLDQFKEQRELDGKVSQGLAEELFEKEGNRELGKALLNFGLNALSDRFMEVHACRKNYVLFSKYYITLTPPDSEKETSYFTAYGAFGRIFPVEDKEEVENLGRKTCSRMEL